MTDTPQTSVVTPKKKAVWLAVFLFFFEVLLMAQFLVPVLVVVWQFLISFPLSFRKQYRGLIKQRFRNIAIYSIAAILAIGANLLNNKIAHDRSEVLVSAVKSFHVKYSRYPNSLNELVPEFIDAVPLAKYTIMGQFRYIHNTETPLLLYVKLPPFGRPTYSFRENRWGYID